MKVVQTSVTSNNIHNSELVDFVLYSLFERSGIVIEQEREKETIGGFNRGIITSDQHINHLQLGLTH